MDEGVLGHTESQSTEESQLHGPSTHSGPRAGLRRSARVQAQLKTVSAAVPLCNQCGQFPPGLGFNLPGMAAEPTARGVEPTARGVRKPG